MTHRHDLPPNAVDAEREVDLARIGRALLARWWLIAGATVIGMAVGALIARGGDPVFQAQSTIYLGQPLSAAGTHQVQNIQRSSAAATRIIKAPALVAEVAADVGLDADALGDSISTRVIRRPSDAAGEGDLMEIIVRGPWQQRSEKAANRLAESAVSQLSTYADSKIADLEGELQVEQAELAALEGQIAELESSIASVDDEAERLRLQTVLSLREEQRARLIEDRVATELGLAVARDIERGRVITEAASRQVDARNRTTSMVVGAFIGLIVGTVGAFGWSAAARHLRRGLQGR